MKIILFITAYIVTGFIVAVVARLHDFDREDMSDIVIAWPLFVVVISFALAQDWGVNIIEGIVEQIRKRRAGE